MRTIEEIFNETHKECAEDNCQSWNNICKLSMEKAVRENTEHIVEKLETIKEFLLESTFEEKFNDLLKSLINKL